MLGTEVLSTLYGDIEHLVVSKVLSIEYRGIEAQGSDAHFL